MKDWSSACGNPYTLILHLKRPKNLPKLWEPAAQTHRTISPPKRNTAASSSLERYRRTERDTEEQDGAAPAAHAAPHTDPAADGTAFTLTTKIEEVKVDISLIRHDMTKLRERVTEAETRIGQAVDTLYPLQHSYEDLQRQLQQLAQKHDDLENRSRRSNLRFIGLPEGADPATFLEQLLINAYGRDTFSTTFVVERAHQMPARRPPEGVPPRTFIAKLLNFKDRDAVLRMARLKGNIPFQSGFISAFPDFSAEVQRQRARFTEVKRCLRAHHIKYAMLFPARLHVAGEDRVHFFEDPTLASEWIDQQDAARNSPA